jgi:hypothetical protein
VSDQACHRQRSAKHRPRFPITLTSILERDKDPHRLQLRCGLGSTRPTWGWTLHCCRALTVCVRKRVARHTRRRWSCLWCVLQERSGTHLCTCAFATARPVGSGNGKQKRSVAFPRTDVAVQVASVKLASPKQWIERRGALNLHPELIDMIDRLVLEPEQPLSSECDCAACS